MYDIAQQRHCFRPFRKTKNLAFLVLQSELIIQLCLLEEFKWQVAFSFAQKRKETMREISIDKFIDLMIFCNLLKRNF